MKDQRQRAILTLVATRPVHSQEELAALLERQGMMTTQATVSRDIKELGLAKVPIRGDADGLFKYVVPSVTASYVSRLHRMMAELAQSVEGSGNLIVIRTPPGSAMMVASAIDDAGWPEVLGTLGGDDTVLVVIDGTDALPTIRQRFLDLQAGSAP